MQYSAIGPVIPGVFNTTFLIYIYNADIIAKNARDIRRIPGLIFNARNEEIIPAIQAIVNERTPAINSIFSGRLCSLSMPIRIPISIARANFLKKSKLTSILLKNCGTRSSIVLSIINTFINT